jgi:hypothetical protein
MYTVTGVPVSATQVDSTTFELLACNLREATRGATKPACVLKKKVRTCKCNLQMYPHCASKLHMPLTSMHVTVSFYRHVYQRLWITHKENGPDMFMQFFGTRTHDPCVVE